MANKILTIFQGLEKAMGGADNSGRVFGGDYSHQTAQINHINSYDMSKGKPIFTAKDRQEYAQKKLELKQQKLLSNMWRKTNYDLTNQQIAGLSSVQIMYRDVELMDAMPEIGAALDIYADESCVTNDKGQIINVISKSSRIKSIIEDLLTNRLDITLTATMVIRAMCKYGNEYMMLNIDSKNGIIGWKQLPIMEMQRNENGITNPYSSYSMPSTSPTSSTSDEITFSWLGSSEIVPFRNFQIAHFRLITDSQFLPYGVSILHKSRRHFRMLSMMEDMMLIYRMDKSIERRVYKIYVGSIDDEDVPAYVDSIADEFKRTPIVDPQTGQLDLRKNIMAVDQDYFIPVRDASAANPIETLQAAQNLTAIDDIKYVQNKVLAGLRIPKTFLNFEEAVGQGNNLSLLDVRFARVINRIQQAFLMELTKVVTIHLYLLGFKDDLTNFTLTMNNPSTQAEQLEIENMEKKVTAVRDAVSDPGGGIPIMSMTRAWRDILKWSDDDITNNLQEIRLEKGLAGELEKTSQIIKRSKIFDPTDNTYGEPNAQYMDSQQGGPGQEGGDMGGGGGGAPMGGGFGGGLEDMGAPDEGGGDMTGEEGAMPPSDAGGPGMDNAQPAPPNESRLNGKKPLIVESKVKAGNDEMPLINEKYDEIMKELDKYIK